MAGLHLFLKSKKENEKKLNKLEYSSRTTGDSHSNLSKQHRELCSALGGKIQLAMSNPETVVIPAGASGSAKKMFHAFLQHTKFKNKHSWIRCLHLPVSVADTLTNGQAASVLTSELVIADGGSILAEVTLGAGTWVAGVASTGQLQVGTGANLVNGDKYTLVGNGRVGGVTKVFEFVDALSALSTYTNIPVIYDAGDDADAVAVKLADAINRVRTLGADPLKITAVAGTGVVDLTQDVVGTDGDTSVTEAVAHVSFTAFDFGDVGNGMTAGAGDKVEVTVAVESSIGAGDGKTPYGVAIAPVVVRIVAA